MLAFCHERCHRKRTETAVEEERNRMREERVRGWLKGEIQKEV